MKFIDYAKIFIKSGDGGPGHISFRREKFVPKGGPDGGNGGKGGDVVLVTDPHINTLLDFKYKREYKAQKGSPGGKNKCSGKDGKNAIIRIPCGTLIKKADTDEVIADMTEPGIEFVLASGGKGGKGNAEFATPTNQTPRYAQPGIPGEEFANVGKSTLISVISEAKPKIADYPFTTLIPNLGMVRLDDFKSYVVADIPGLIEGASKGKGLGHRFLRHVERTRVLLFMIESFSNDPINDYETLLNELLKYNPEMKLKNKIICFSKTDVLTPDSRTELNKVKFPGYKSKPMMISAVSHENIEELKRTLWQAIEKESKT